MASTIRTRAEAFALGSFLADYPDTGSYKRMLRLIELESPRVVVWEPFEHYPPEYLIEQIEAMKDSVEGLLRREQELLIEQITQLAQKRAA